MPNDRTSFDYPHGGWRGSAPVIIGGVGGSGTRALAEVIHQIGWFIGNDLNESNDLLSFTLLFKRSAWYRRIGRRRWRKCRIGLRLLRRSVLEGRRAYSVGDIVFLLQATIDIYRNGHDWNGNGRGQWAIERFRRIWSSRGLPADTDCCGWGWKEPNTHLYLSEILRFFPEGRYILLMRNGLDMVYSSNQAQVHNWGPHFGVDGEWLRQNREEATLEYWIRANEAAIDTGRRFGPNRFFPLRFEALCLDTRNTLLSLAQFLGIYPETVMQWRHLIRPPSSIGRFRNHDSGRFDPAQLQKVRDMGFEVH